MRLALRAQPPVRPRYLARAGIDAWQRDEWPPLRHAATPDRPGPHRSRLRHHAAGAISVDHSPRRATRPLGYPEAVGSGTGFLAGVHASWHGSRPNDAGPRFGAAGRLRQRSARIPMAPLGGPVICPGHPGSNPSEHDHRWNGYRHDRHDRHDRRTNCHQHDHRWHGYCHDDHHHHHHHDRHGRRMNLYHYDHRWSRYFHAHRGDHVRQMMHYRHDDHLVVDASDRPKWNPWQEVRPGSERSPDNAERHHRRSDDASQEELRRRPTLPGDLSPSTIGADRLNFRVRDGNGCDPVAMATENQLSTCGSHTRTPEQARAGFQALGRLVPVS